MDSSSTLGLRGYRRAIRWHWQLRLWVWNIVILWLLKRRHGSHLNARWDLRRVKVGGKQIRSCQQGAKTGGDNV